MGKVFVRLTIILVTIYFMLSYLFAFNGIDIMTNSYTILFEICVVIYCFSEGKYHCKFMRFTALSLLLSDVITRIDNRFNILSVEWHNLIPFLLCLLGITISFTLAIKHFIRVYHINQKRHKL